MKNEKVINLEMLSKLLEFSNRYEISIQFWPDQTAVFIGKDGVQLTDFGGDFEFAVGSATDYLCRINNVPKITFKTVKERKKPNSFNSLTVGGKEVVIDGVNGGSVVVSKEQMPELIRWLQEAEFIINETSKFVV